MTSNNNLEPSQGTSRGRDEGNREGLAIEIGTSIPSTRRVRIMEQLIDLHGQRAEAIQLRYI